MEDVFYFVVEAEAEGREQECHEYDNGHTYECDLPQRVHGRVFGKDQYANAYEHDCRRQQDALSVLGEYRLACASLVELPFGDENSVVVTLSEDECSEDDIDDIERYAA